MFRLRTRKVLRSEGSGSLAMGFVQSHTEVTHWWDPHDSRYHGDAKLVMPPWSSARSFNLSGFNRPIVHLYYWRSPVRAEKELSWSVKSGGVRKHFNTNWNQKIIFRPNQPLSLYGLFHVYSRQLWSRMKCWFRVIYLLRNLYWKEKDQSVRYQYQ